MALVIMDVPPWFCLAKTCDGKAPRAVLVKVAPIPRPATPPRTLRRVSDRLPVSGDRSGAWSFMKLPFHCRVGPLFYEGRCSRWSSVPGVCLELEMSQAPGGWRLGATRGL